MNLSDNFTLHEMTKSETADKYGIDNTPDSTQIKNAIYLCKMTLQPLRHWYSTMILSSSWFRCKELNDHDKIKGSKTSFHLTGGAIDINSVGLEKLIDVVEFVYRNLYFTEMIAEYLPTGWIHLATIEGREDERVLKVKDKNHNYKVVTLEELKEILNG